MVKRQIAMLVAFLAGTPLYAHHSLSSEYDSSRVMSITGIVTRVEWINPHAWIHMNVKDTEGKTVLWRIQIASVGGLTRAGFEKSFLDFTSSITVQVWPAFHDPSAGRVGTGRLLTLSDGRTFDVSDKWQETKNMK